MSAPRWVGWDDRVATLHPSSGRILAIVEDNLLAVHSLEALITTSATKGRVGVLFERSKAVRIELYCHAIVSKCSWLARDEGNTLPGYGMKMS